MTGSLPRKRLALGLMPIAKQATTKTEETCKSLREGALSGRDDMVMKARNSSSPELEAGLSQVKGQCGLHRESLSQKTKREKRKKKESMNLRDYQMNRLSVQGFPGIHFEAHGDISFEAFTTNPSDKESVIRRIMILESYRLAKEVQASPLWSLPGTSAICLQGTLGVPIAKLSLHRSTHLPNCTYHRA